MIFFLLNPHHQPFILNPPYLSPHSQSIHPKLPHSRLPDQLPQPQSLYPQSPHPQSPDSQSHHHLIYICTDFCDPNYNHIVCRLNQAGWLVE